jgi:hypothetical protein
MKASTFAVALALSLLLAAPAVATEKLCPVGFGMSTRSAAALWRPATTIRPTSTYSSLIYPRFFGVAVLESGAEELPRLQATGAQMKVLGVGFDLLRLRPEVILRLDLTEQAALPPEDALDQSEYMKSQLIDLTTRSLERFWSSRNPLNITPSGAATVALLEATS